MKSSLSFFALLVISSFVYLLSRKIKLPYTVLLFITGLVLVFISKLEFFSWITYFKLTPELLFFVFLPILVFESAYNINYKELLKNSKTIFALSVVGLLISTFLIWLGLYFLFDLIGLHIPFGVSLLFGALISATDPVAVLALFKSVGAPRRLSLIFEWESLFNDWTALAIFLIILWVLIEMGTTRGENFNLLTSVTEWVLMFLSMIIGWILFGLFIWFVFSKLLEKIKNVEKVEITLTLVAAHLTFLLSEIITEFTFLKISGIIATAVTGILMWNYWRTKVSPKVEEYMEKFWSYAAWVANSLVFLLMGLVLADVNISFVDFLPYILITIAVVIIARWISVYLPLGIINKFKLEKPIPVSRQHLLAWWSLRWALALVMVLMIPDNFTLPGWNYNFSIKEFLIVLVISSVMFTLIVKALTIQPLMRKLKIWQLHSLEKFEYYEGQILALLKMLDKLENLYKVWYLLTEEYEELKNKYSEKLALAFKWMKKLLKDEKDKEWLIKKAISLHALSIEQQYLKELFKYNEIDELNYRVLLWKIKRQKERLEEWLPQFRGNDLSFDDKNIFEKFLEASFDKDSPENVYIRNRARVIILRKTIEDLKELAQVGFPIDKKYFDEIISLYETMLKQAQDKIKNLVKKYKATIMGLEVRLSEKTLLKIEESVIKELYEKELITPKLYNKFMEEIEANLYNK